MFANGYVRIFHYHLKKCAGTSLNSWLRLQAADTKYLPERLQGGGTPESASLHKVSRSEVDFFLNDRLVLYSHRPFTDIVPDKTFTITVLRQPKARLVSQVADWRREARVGREVPYDPVVDRALKDTARLRLRDYLREYASIVPALFDNYVTRALASDYGDENVWLAETRPSTLVAAAKQRLASRYHVVGLTERFRETGAAICTGLGLAPDLEFGGKKNVSSGLIGADEIAEADDELSKLTEQDREIYDLAVLLFEKRHASRAAFDEAEFESRHAADAVNRLTMIRRGESAVFSVRDALIGTGFHGRDGEGLDQCAVWTGPATRSILYMPVPARHPIVVQVWLRGFASEHQLHQLRFEIDDCCRSHQFCGIDGWLVAEIPVEPVRSFCKIALLLDETVADAPGGDPRLRGLAFDAYGWRPQRSA